MLGSILWRAEQKESEPKCPLGLIEVKLKIVKPKIPKILEVKASGAPERKPKSARQQKNEKKKKNMIDTLYLNLFVYTAGWGI